MQKLKIIIWLYSACILFACANPGVPQGGQKDEKAPLITKTSPENYSVNFDKKRIVIDFDEFVKLNDAFKNVVLSPPQKKKPKVRLKERQIVIDLRDSLRDHTTYTLGFGKAIVDNNEGNPLGEYRYVFSTGEKIDEMGIAGYVKGAKLDTIAEGATVALYTPSDTLNPYALLPDYLAKTDSMGFFMFNNIVDRSYKIIAFQDENSNNMLDPDEPLAFLNKEIHPSIAVDAEGKQDSLQLDNYTKFKNTNLQLCIFKPSPSQQYLKDYQRPLREQITLVFNAPRNDSLHILFLEESEDPEFVIEKTPQNDSLVYWIMNNKVMQRDTLLASLSYLRTDSLGRLVPHDDTLKFTYKEPKKSRKEQKKEEDVGPMIDFMEIQTNMSGELNYFDTLSLNFKRPVLELKKEDIHIFTLQDSTEISKDFTLERDALFPYRVYHVKLPLEQEVEYNLRIDSMKIYDIGGRPNKLLETAFQIYDESHYGKIFVTIAGGEKNLLIQLVDKQDSEVIVAEQRWEQDGKMVFENLQPETYLLRALWDTNGNGKWDPGDYKKQLQPERGHFFSKEIELPSNWELEVAWTLKKEGNEENND